MRYRPPTRADNLQIVRDVVVVAEGKDDADLIQWLLSHPIGSRPNLDDTVQVIDARSKDKIRPMIDEVVKSDLFQGRGRALGIVRDADDSPAAAVRAINAALAAAGVDLDAVEGVTQAGSRRVGLFLSPGTSRLGAIDELYLESADEQRRAAATEHVDAVERAFGQLKNTSKGVLQVLLGSLPSSPRQPGDALQQALVTRTAALEPLADFLVELVGPRR